MSLQGTFETFSLPEILELVERARKTGALEVRGQDRRGTLYFAGGRFSAGETDELYGPVVSAEALESRLVDVCFALFRLESGGFEFESDRFPAWPVQSATEVAPIIEQVEELRREWPAIEAVIPSLDCCPDVVSDLDGDQLVLDRAGFRVLRVVDGRRTVREVARELGCGVLDAGRVLRDLVEAGAVTISAEPRRSAVREVVLADRKASAMAQQVTAELAAANGLAALPDLPEVPGLVVPSSLEGLTEPIPESPVSRAATAPRPGGEAAGPAAPPDPLADPLPDPPTDGEARRHDPPVHEPEPAAADPARLIARIEAPIDAPTDAPVGAAMPVGPAPEGGTDPGHTSNADDDDDPPPDRGALLRLFSALRDT